MVYYVIEGTIENNFNAGSKARIDVEKIFEKNNFQKLYIDTVKEKNKNKLKKILEYRNNTKIWYESLKKLNNGDTLIIQYPLTNPTLNLYKVIKKYKNINFISIIHDLSSLRFDESILGKIAFKKAQKEDKYLLNTMNKIIAHNYSMKNELIKLGNNKDDIIELELFDYLVNNQVEYKDRNKIDPIIIAGNLSFQKAGYLRYLNKVNYNFNLYGIGFEKELESKNIDYKGKFLPEELVNKLEGSFGLIWDGPIIETCTTKIGEYLKYNNPHKTSLYLTAGIPVIVWSESAQAKFVLENNIGIVISDLNDLDKEINKITDEEYSKMLENAREISKKLQEGYYTNKALSQIIK